MSETDRPKHNQMHEDIIFCTEPKKEDQNAKQLKKYVNNMDKKIDYAKWKQNLVLSYNYMPLKRITQKVQAEKANYLKLIAQEEKRCAKILSGKQITVQLGLFREFKIKLAQKLFQLDTQIENLRIKKNSLQIISNEKKQRLKELMKQNMIISKAKLQRTGITTKQGLVSLARSRSTKDRFVSLKTQQKTMNKSVKANKSTKTTSLLSTSRNKPGVTNILYQDCLQQMIHSIHAMKSAEDVQSGIYLDIMKKRENKYSRDGRYSLKSKVCDTLMHRFSEIQAQQKQKEKEKADFQMDWQTFKDLNWKQIMGILLVKDKDSEIIKKLLTLHFQ